MRASRYAAASAGTKAISPSTTGFNVTDFGARGDGATDDTLAFERALTAAGQYGTVLIPPGTYLIDLNLGNNKPVLQGAGPGGTVLKAFTAGGTPLKTGSNAAWILGHVRDLRIDGNGTRTDTGFQMGSDPEVNQDEYGGRWVFENVHFTNLKYCVRKLHGQIGNQFKSCYFATADYHVHAVDHDTADVMHAGNDLFTGCRFESAQLASYYIDSAAETAQVVFSRCLWESIPGFVLFVEELNALTQGGLVVENCHQENNATAGSVTIDGTAYTPREFYLRNCDSAEFVGTRLGSVELISSVAFHRNCQVDDVSLTIDGDSAFVGEDINADSSLNAHYSRSIKSNARRAAAAQCSVFLLEPRRRVTHRYAANLEFSDTGQFTKTWSGGASPASTKVADGTLFDMAQEVTLGASTYSLPTAFSLAANKWIVWTAEVQFVSGTAPQSVSWTGGGAFSGPFPLAGAGVWRCFGAVVRTGSSVINSEALHVTGPASGSAVMRFGAMQVLAFDTLQEALEFLDGGFFQLEASGNPIPREMTGSAAPTTGTWKVGDRVWDNSPAAGGYVGWICTTAGSPGTWKEWGAIVA